MSVFNSADTIGQAIESILDQTYKNFEFIIIDDGSLDGSVEVVKLFNDARVILISNVHNVGLTKCLNDGLAIARGKYIVRMDADDISVPERIEKQVAFMEANPEVGICGTGIRIFGDIDTVKVHPERHDEICVKMIYANPIAHPTVVIRRKYLRDHKLEYNANLATSQDYDLWYRSSKLFRLANLPAPLLYYRAHSGQISSERAMSQQRDSNQIRYNILRDLGLTCNEDTIADYHRLFEELPLDERHALRVKNLIFSVLGANRRTGIFNHALLRKLIIRKWISCLSKSGIPKYDVWFTIRNLAVISFGDAKMLAYLRMIFS